MRAEKATVIGRRAELAAVEEYVDEAAVVLVRGGAGTGKTALLDELRRTWRIRGITVIRLNFSASSTAWDKFGGRPVFEPVQHDLHEIGDSRLIASMAVLNRLSLAETHISASGRSILVAELVRLFRSLRGRGSVAVLLDDLHAAPHPDLAVWAAHQAGCTVVATCREYGVAEPMSPGVIPDRVLDLAPLPDEEIGELLAAATRGHLDEGVSAAIQAGLGTLAGNPGAVLGVFEQLVENGRLVEVHGRLCLADPAASIALPADHHLVRSATRFGEQGTQLLGLIASMDRCTVDDLMIFAAATGRDFGDCGRMVDQLVVAGVLDYDDNGMLSVPCPALSATLLRDLCPVGMASLHAAIAERLARTEGSLFAAPAATADHLALAGAALPPDPAMVAPLETEATRMLRGDPVRAALRYGAAFRHCDPGGPDYARILGTLLRLLVKIGDYRRLGEVVIEAVTECVENEHRYELAVSAALAAVHTGVPVPEPVRAALAGYPGGAEPLEFAEAWFDGGESFDGDRLESAFGAFRGEGPLGEEASEALDVAADRHDVVTMFKVVIGSGYGEPATGPLAIFGRIARNFAGGDWRGIPSDARRLELSGSTTPAIHVLARLITAEVLSSFGEVRQAHQWLEQVGVGCPFPATRAWVEMGITYRSGEWDCARERGWAAYVKIAAGVDRGVLTGLSSFLTRLAYLERMDEGAENLRRLRDDAQRWRARHGGVSLRVTELILRGLADNDYAAATEAVGILREQGLQGELMRALITVAFTTDEPRPWYQEACDIARRLGGDWMLMNIKTAMRDTTVALPSYRKDQDALTKLEERIIDLIRRGMTNRQIGVAIHMKEKTVENLLTRLFAKTGCRSRLELTTASIGGRLTVMSADCAS
ncbi:AAA family ATPase [Amycolatopsis sp. NPDC059657]|uniref:helix-turn-helix transcriptional regulator n=1 Tax=Amycolatopsis sp. NPDC059657 TaxID=3346899 RepID=UPI00366D4F5F